MNTSQLKMKCQRYEAALKEIATLEEFDEAQESIIRLLFQINDTLLAVRSIAIVALEETQTLLPDPEFEPFPDELGNCPKCGKALAVRNGKRGKFIGCTGYPSCKFTKDLYVDYDDDEPDGSETGMEECFRIEYGIPSDTD